MSVGLSQVPFAGTEIERFTSLSDIRNRSSAVVVARILSRGPDRTIVGDVSDDVLTMTSVEIEVIEPLAGTRRLNRGDVLLLEPMQGLPDLAAGTVWIMFLRNKQDDLLGAPNPDALPGEIGIWRQVNSQGLFIDGGGGRPLNPVAAAAAWSEANGGASLEDFTTSTYDPTKSSDPVELEVASMTVEEMLRFLRETG